MERKGSENTFHGVTTDSYSQNTIKTDVGFHDAKSVSVKNTDSTNGLLFKIVAYFDKAENAEKTLKSEETLAFGDIYNYMLDGTQMDHIKVFLKNAVSLTPATWLVVFNVN